MAYVIAQGGSTLYRVDLTSGVATALSLPTGITLSTTRKPRFAVMNQWVALVNSPNRNLVIDPEGTVRVLVPRAPEHGPSVVAGGSTGLTGAYQYKYSFIVKDADGNLLMESPLSPASVSVTLANQDASLTDIAPSLDNISARRLYRTLSGGTAYYHVADIEGNVSEALLENTSDATVTLLPALSDTLQSPPGTIPGARLKLVVQWKSRFWAVSDDRTLQDTVYATETNKVYAWPNQLVAYPVGQDGKGITSFAVKKNQLGILKRNGLWTIAGTSSSTGIAITNVSVQQLAWDKAGSLSPDTVLTIDDQVYYLGRDGVYVWGENGVESISDEQVMPWFQSDTYFNRTRFQYAFARYNELRDTYELHLAAAGSSSEDRWVSYNIKKKVWYGPHVTGAFTPSHAGFLVDANGLPVTLVGGTDGVIYVANSANKRDGAATAIDMDCYGPWHSADAPDIEHFWGKLSMVTKIEAAGTLSVTPYTGGLDAAAQTALSHDLTTGRERLAILGDGRLMRLRIRKNTLNQSATIYGYEVDPVFENGRR